MIILFIALLFLPPIALRETKSIFNIAHDLSRVSNAINRNQQQEEKETKNTIKLDLCFILGVILNNMQI